MNRTANSGGGAGRHAANTSGRRRRRFPPPWIPAPILEAALRLRHFFDRRLEDVEMDEELQFHLEMEAAQLARSGMSEDQARRAARLAFGGVDGHREQIREARGFPLLEDFWRDVKYAGRSFWRDRTFTIVAITILGVGLGAASGVLAFINYIAVEPLRGIQQPERTALIEFVHARQAAYGTVHGRERVAYLEAQRSFETNGGVENRVYGAIALEANDRVEQVAANVVIGDYFGALRLDMSMGRGVVDAIADDAQSVVLSHDLWRTRFNSSPDVIGRVVRLNAQPLTIVGVGPKGFPSAGDIWLTAEGVGLVMGSRPEEVFNRTSQAYFGRLKPGVSREEAAAEASAIAETFDEVLPHDPRDPTVTAARVRPPTYITVEQGAGAFVMLSILTILILGVVGANLGVLLLGRAMARRQEIAVRLALGASRPRLVKQLLTEGIVLAILGSISAVIGIRAASEITLSIEEMDLALAPSWQTSAATVALAAIVGVLFSVAPALHATVGSLRNALTDSAAAGSRRSVRLQKGLVVAAFAIAGGLASIAGLVVARVLEATTPTAGYEVSDQVGVITLRPHFLGFVLRQTPDLATRLTERLHRIPGVESVGWSEGPPEWNEGFGIHVPGWGVPFDAGSPPPVVRDFAGPGYFKTLGIPITAGREFRVSDDLSAPTAVIISEDIAERLWPGLDPIGRTLDYERLVSQTHPRTSHQALVVGVTGGKGRRAFQADGGFSPVNDARPIVFFAEQQHTERLDSRTFMLTLFVRTGADWSTRIEGQLLSAIQEVEPGLVVGGMETTRDRHWEAHEPELVGAYTAAAGGAVILLIAAIGVYGVIMFRLNQRRRELAITRALGAEEGRVVMGSFKEGMVLAAGGLALGLAASLIVVRFGFAGNLEPEAVAIVSAALFCVACLACWLPARRATRIEPMEALRV